MRDALLRLGVVLVAALLLLGVTADRAPSGLVPEGGVCLAADGPDPRPHCCFTNSRYVGTCEVEPAKDETCAGILEYLNNPQSTGKTYCNSTNVRGGWKQVPCEPGMKQD